MTRTAGHSSARRWLLLRRSPSVVYAGTWRMVGGKVESGAVAWEAVSREPREETGLSPRLAWVLPPPPGRARTE